MRERADRWIAIVTILREIWPPVSKTFKPIQFSPGVFSKNPRAMTKRFNGRPYGEIIIAFFVKLTHKGLNIGIQFVEIKLGVLFNQVQPIKSPGGAQGAIDQAWEVWVWLGVVFVAHGRSVDDNTIFTKVRTTRLNVTFVTLISGCLSEDAVGANYSGPDFRL